MRMNDTNQSYDRIGKKGVTFDAVETLERKCNSIDKLSSLISKMNVKWTEKRPHISLEFTKIDLGARVEVNDNLISLATDSLVGIGIEIEETLVVILEIIDTTIEIDLEIITDLMTEDIPIGLLKGTMIMDQITGIEAITDKIVEMDKII